MHIFCNVKECVFLDITADNPDIWVCRNEPVIQQGYIHESIGVFDPGGTTRKGPPICTTFMMRQEVWCEASEQGCDCFFDWETTDPNLCRCCINRCYREGEFETSWHDDWRKYATVRDL